MTAPRIVLRRATKRYLAGGRAVVAFDAVDLEVGSGEVVCVLGPSGSGKTSLLRILAGLEPLDEGEALHDGRPIAAPDPSRALVFQDHALFPWLSVAANVAFGPRARGATAGLDRRVAELIALVGLDGFERALPHQLSGGMAQRVAFARALANDPDVLLLDEPLGALDIRTRSDLQDELARILRAEGLTAVVVTHDLDEALVLADRIVILSASPGRLARHIAVPLPRPRDRASEGLLRLRALLVAAVLDTRTGGKAA
jgi:sulfonate transport system ATP-binding protein